MIFFRDLKLEGVNEQFARREIGGRIGRQDRLKKHGRSAYGLRATLRHHDTRARIPNPQR